MSGGSERRAVLRIAAKPPGLTVVDDCDLCEMHNGEADGLTWQEYDARYGRFNIVVEGAVRVRETAESAVGAVYDRA